MAGKVNDTEQSRNEEQLRPARSLNLPFRYRASFISWRLANLAVDTQHELAQHYQVSDQTSLLRRVADALHQLRVQNGGTSRGPADMVEDARSILTVMRPTSAAMREAGGQRLSEMNRSSDYESDAAVAWTAIIDQAISE